MPLVSAITDFVTAHPHLAYAAVFLLALSEAIPVVGAVVPGSALVIGISAMVPSGTVALWPLLLAATAGAISGDGLSFWLGRRYHRAVLDRWPLRRHPELVARSEAFLHRHGGKSVFLARFTPGVRAFVPLLAGIARMPGRRFYAANILSALAWAPSHVLPGVLVGASFAHAAGAAAGRLAVLLIAVAVVLWAVTRLVRVALRRGLPVLAAGEERLSRWAGARDTWLRRQARSLLDPARPETRALALAAAVVIAAAWLFFGILDEVATGEPLLFLDVSLYRLLQSLRTRWGDTVMIALTELGDSAVTGPVTAAVFLWLAWRRAWRAALYWTAAVGVASLVNSATKIALLRAHPDAAALSSGWSAFASGHATVNTVLYGFLAFLIARHLRPAWRAPAVAAAVSLATLIAFSRLYLGVHWFSEVVGSLIFATAWVVVLGVAYVHHRPPRLGVAGLTGVAAAAVIFAGGGNIHRQHAANTERYAIRYEEPTMDAAAWWREDWRHLRVRRVDLAGEVEEPLTIQWAGDLDSLKRDLRPTGWRAPEPWTLANALAWFAAPADPLALPVLPSLDGGRLPSLTLVHPAGEDRRRLVLRLWAADRQLTTHDGGRPQPLWVGSVVEERLRRPLSLVTVTLAQSDAEAPRRVLGAALGSGRRLVARDNEEGTDSDWDGEVLLAYDLSLAMDLPAIPTGSDEQADARRRGALKPDRSD